MITIWYENFCLCETVINGYGAKISGGVQIDGSEIGPIKEDEIIKQAKIIKSKSLQKVAVIGIYSPFDEEYKQEYQVRDVLKKELGDEVEVVCSRDGETILSYNLPS